MAYLRELLDRYKQMAAYRDGEFRRKYNRESLQKFSFLALLTSLMLGLDLLSVGFFASLEVQGNAVRILELVSIGLGICGSIALCSLHKRLSSGVRELGRGLALLVLLVYFLRGIYFELQLSGGLYMYVIFLVLSGEVANLRLLENLVMIVSADLLVVYAHLMDGLSVSGGQIYLSPLRMLGFCSFIALLLAVQRNYSYLTVITQRAQLRRISSKDALTGLLNRRGMEEFVRHKMPPGQVCAAIFDIDDFKKYNDTYGHAAGDDCLRLVARLVKELAERQHGLAVRYGGEEMVVLFFTGKKERVKEAISAMQSELRALKRPSGRGAEHPVVTVSCGLMGSKRTPGHNVDEVYRLIAAADKNLYVAKSCGKDCMVG